MRVTGTGIDGNEPSSWLSVGQLGEVERAFHRDSPVQTLVAEVRMLRGRVATLEEDVVLEAEACDAQSAQLLEIAETIGVVPGVAVVPGVKALLERVATLEDGIRERHRPTDVEVEQFHDVDLDGPCPEPYVMFGPGGGQACPGHLATMQTCDECGYDQDGDVVVFRPWPCPTVSLLDASHDQEDDDE